MRSLAIANALADKIPGIEIRFVLNQKVEYLKDCPFPVYQTPDSPTKYTTLVNGFIDEFKPNAVIFDASGRAKQLQHCKRRGISTIFICQHSKKLNKGLGWRRLRFTDRIWIVQPKFAIQPLGLWAKTKIRWLAKPAPLAIGPIFTPPNQGRLNDLHKEYQLEAGKYVIINAGGGGHYREFEGKRINTADLFAKAALLLTQAPSDLKVVMIYGPNYTGTIGNEAGMISIGKLASEDFNTLLSAAHSAILGGGSALLQAISYGVNVVAVAVSKDQQERIDACMAQGLVTQSPPEPKAMAASQQSLSITTAISPPITKPNTDSTSVTNGLYAALDDLDKLLNPSACS